MPRGGTRVGAGRRRCLGADQRLAIGAECEQRWDSKIERKRFAGFEHAKVIKGYADIVAEAQDVPAVDRREWLRSQAGVEHSEIVSESLRAIQEQIEGRTLSDDEEPSRVVNPAAVRPYNLRVTIWNLVAEWATERFGIPVSSRTVRSCWQEYRAFLRNL